MAPTKPRQQAANQSNEEKKIYFDVRKQACKLLEKYSFA